MRGGHWRGALLLGAAAFLLGACGGGSSDGGDYYGSAWGDALKDSSSTTAPDADGSSTEEPTTATDDQGVSLDATPTAAADTPVPIEPTVQPTPAPPTPTATPTLHLTVNIMKNCEFDPPVGQMNIGGSVTFANYAGVEVNITLYLPNDLGIDGGGIEPSEASDPYKIDAIGRTIITCDIGESDTTTFGSIAVTA